MVVSPDRKFFWASLARFEATVAVLAVGLLAAGTDDGPPPVVGLVGWILAVVLSLGRGV